MIRFAVLLVAVLSVAPSPEAQPAAGGRSEIYAYYMDYVVPGGFTDARHHLGHPGGPMYFAGTVRVPNEGSPAPAGPFNVAFVLSTDTYYSPDDIELARFRSEGLQQGQQAGYIAGLHGIVVPNVPNGPYFILMIGDVDEEVAETDETDNERYLRFTVGGSYFGGSNLLGSGGELDDGSVEAGDRVQVSYSIFNYMNLAPDGESGEFTNGYYLRRVGNGPAPYTFLESEPIGSVESRETEDEDEEVNIPPSTPPGEYTLSVFLDDGNVVEEWDESNTVSFRLTVEDPQHRPVLSTSENLTSIPRTLTPDAEIRVWAYVFNKGQSAAPAAMVGVVLSRDATYSPDDLVIARAATSEIAPGDDDDARGTFTLPPGVPPGQYVAIVVPDVDNAAGLPESMRQYYGHRYVTVSAPVTAGETPGTAAPRLLPPSPNPARGAIQIAFALSAPSSVRLTVVDILGRVVAVLADGERASGRHTATLNASALPAGVYLVRLVAKGETQTQRITVAR